MVQCDVEMLMVTVAHSPRPGEVQEISVELPVGSTVADGIAQSGFSLLNAQGVAAVVGVWGAVVSLSQVLRHNDRIEIYRPLQVDPKEARRLRQLQQARGPSKKVKRR